MMNGYFNEQYVDEGLKWFEYIWYSYDMSSYNWLLSDAINDVHMMVWMIMNG